MTDDKPKPDSETKSKVVGMTLWNILLGIAVWIMLAAGWAPNTSLTLAVGLAVFALWWWGADKERR